MERTDQNATTETLPFRRIKVSSTSFQPAINSAHAAILAQSGGSWLPHQIHNDRALAAQVATSHCGSSSAKVLLYGKSQFDTHLSKSLLVAIRSKTLEAPTHTLTVL